MKQLRRLKNMIFGGEEAEKPEEAEQPEADTQTKPTETETKPSEKQATEEVTKAKGEPASTESLEPEEAEEKAVSADPKEVKEKPKTKRSDSMTLLEGRDVQTATRTNLDESFKQQVIDAGAESLALCFQCGTCTGACPSGRRTPYRVRQLVRRSLMGFKEELIADDTIWMCSTCYECQERCPRAIKIVDIIKIVRNYASQAGYMGAAHKAVGSYVIKTGHGVPINDATMELRKRVGLTELPPTTHQFPEALKEVQTILKTTQFDSLIGYNWETGQLE